VPFNATLRRQRLARKARGRGADFKRARYRRPCHRIERPAGCLVVIGKLSKTAQSAVTEFARTFAGRVAERRARSRRSSAPVTPVPSQCLPTQRSGGRKTHRYSSSRPSPPARSSSSRASSPALETHKTQAPIQPRLRFKRSDHAREALGFRGRFGHFRRRNHEAVSGQRGLREACNNNAALPKRRRAMSVNEDLEFSPSLPRRSPRSGRTPLESGLSVPAGSENTALGLKLGDNRSCRLDSRGSNTSVPKLGRQASRGAIATVLIRASLPAHASICRMSSSRRASARVPLRSGQGPIRYVSGNLDCFSTPSAPAMSEPAPEPNETKTKFSRLRVHDDRAPRRERAREGRMAE